MNTLGNHIRNIRKSKGLTLKQLSEKSEVSVPFLSDIERDTVNTSVKILQNIALSLGVSLPEIVNYNDDLNHRLLTENQQLKETIQGIRWLLEKTSC